jgi:formate/nitrite transporter FocA (FNT family)
MADKNEAELNQLTRLPSKVIYEIISRDGEEELARPFNSLWWSGVVAGIAISSSLIAEGMLREKLPDTSWRPILENFGYCFGFLIVVLGRLQLFTENTITAVLPLMADFNRASLGRTLRIWSIVLVANLVGTFSAALCADMVIFVDHAQLAPFYELAHELLAKSQWEMFVHAVPAGFYIAAMVWMIPSARGFEIWVIMLMTYLIALGDFSHVIAGSVEAFLLLVDGQIGVYQTVFGFLLPALAGNVLGGTMLFSILAYAQVSQEIE